MPLSILGAVVFFFGLWLLDFPKPMTDDLFYCGAALNLAGGGDFSNPLLARQEFPSHFYFVYPPVHSYALAGWLKVFGISAASMTGFPIVMYLAMAVATIAILRRHGAPVWLEWLVPFGVFAAFSHGGLRTEAMSAALITTGFALIACAKRPARMAFPGFLLLAFGGLTAPRMMIFAAALALLGGWCSWRAAAPGRSRALLLAAALAAGTIAGLALLWMIGFRLQEFLHTIHYHASGVANRFGPGKVQLFRLFIRTHNAGQLPLLVLPFLLLPAALKRPLGELARAGLVLAGGFLAAALLGGLYYGADWQTVLMLFLLAASLLRNASRPRTLLLAAAISLALLAANIGEILPIAGVLTGRIQRDAGDRLAAAHALRPTPDHPVLIDCSVARYVYDYRIPQGYLDFAFGSRFPKFHVTQSELRPGDIFLVGPSELDVLNIYTYLNAPAPAKFRCILARWTFYRRPREVFIIPAEACHSLRQLPPQNP